METLEFFKKLRDISTEIVEAMEKEDTEKLEASMGRFIFLMAQADCLK
jgi:hypothetical protein